MLETAILIAALGAMFCWGVGDFLIQRAIRAVGNLETLFFISVGGSLGLLPFVAKDLVLLFSGLVWPILLLLLCLCFVVLVTSYLDFEALRAGKLSVVETLFTLELPIAVALGILVFQETLSLLQGILIALILLGIVLVAVERFSPRDFLWERGAWFALCAAMLFGFLNFLTAAAARAITPLLAIFLPWTFTGIVLLVILLRRDTSLFSVPRLAPHVRLLLAVVVIDTAAWVFYASALVDGELGIVTAITESYPAIAVVLGVWLNKERIRAHQWFGAALALGMGVALALLS